MESIASRARRLRRASEISGRLDRAQSRLRVRAGPIGARQSPAGEMPVTEDAQPERPISNPTQAPSELPAT